MDIYDYIYENEMLKLTLQVKEKQIKQLSARLTRWETLSAKWQGLASGWEKLYRKTLKLVK